MSPSIRTISFLGFALGAGLLSTPTATAQKAAITTQRIASGLSAPLFVTYAPLDRRRLFILEQGSGGTARIKIFSRVTNTILPTPFLTVSGISTGGERGLLGLAFDPNYASNGNFYIHVSNSDSQNSVRRYKVSSNPNVADPASAFDVLVMADPFSNHNGGWIDFNRDGFLYIATGDGGSGNDPQNAAQNLGSFLGKILRINPNGPDAFPADPTRNYAIPATNPFATQPGALGEIWHYGLRNPWRVSFDLRTRDLWIGDVGQGAVEEIDFARAGVGGLNFGWRCMEGLSCTGLSGCACNDTALTLPVQTYTHAAGGCSVTGGYRYRGDALCGWQGTYFYADYCSDKIWSFDFNGTSIFDFADRTAQLAPGGGLSIGSIASFGQDVDGELYIVDQGGGEIFKIVRSATFPDCNANSADDACDIQAGTSADANDDGIPDECQP